MVGWGVSHYMRNQKRWPTIQAGHFVDMTKRLTQ